MSELLFLRRGTELLRVAVDRSRIILGRAETSDVVVPDASVGWHQAAVLFDGNSVSVEDLSGQGTVVSGEKTLRTPLREGADIALGPWQAVFRGTAHSSDSSGPGKEARRWNPTVATVRVFGAEASGNLAESAGQPSRPSLQVVLGADPGIRLLADFLQRMASARSVVCIFGEPGSGRELVARALHARSGQSRGPFIRVNCRSLRGELLEGELWGQQRESGHGAGVPQSSAFEEAAGGTLFLDEVGELSLSLQERLLRVLEAEQLLRAAGTPASTQPARLVVATNRDLLSATRLGSFREDLFDVLCMAPLILPPLRHRRGDVPALASHLVKTFSPRGESVRITPQALDQLTGYAWPGNIRELRNVIQQALLLRVGQSIDVAELRFAPGPQTSSAFVPGRTLEQMLRQREREIVESALRHFDNNRERVARELGVARSTLFKRLKDWGLTKHDAHPPLA